MAVWAPSWRRWGGRNGSYGCSGPRSAPATPSWSCTYKLGGWWSLQSGASCSALDQCLPDVGVPYRWPCCCWQSEPSPAGGSTSGPAAGQKGSPQWLRVSWSGHPEALDPHFHVLSLFPSLSHDLSPSSFRLSPKLVFQGLTKDDVSVSLSLAAAC